MTFPRTPLDIRTELFLDGQWVDVSGDVYNRDPVTITYGRADEAARPDPKTLSLTLSNRDGKYSPRNPRSPLYGKLRRNTPIRVSVPGGETYLDLDGSVDGFASTPYDPSLDLAGRDLDVRVEASLDWNNPTKNQSVIGRWEPEGDQRSWSIRVSNGVLYYNISTDGTTAGGWWWGWELPPLPRRAAIRMTMEAATATVTFYWAESLDGPWHQLRDPITIETVTPFESTAPLRVGVSEPIQPSPRTPLEGRVHRIQVSMDRELVAAPDFRSLTPGQTEFEDETGRTWSLHGTARISDRYIRFEGEVDSWPASWAPNGGDSWISIKASGVTRRLGQRAKALTSVLTRRITSFEPVAYWPFEDSEGSEHAWSPIEGVRPADARGFSFGGDSPPGSAALPTIQEGAYLNAQVPYHEGGDFWAVSWVMYISDVPSEDIPLIRVGSSGTAVRHHVFIGPSGLELVGYGPRSGESYFNQEEKYHYTASPSSRSFQALFGRWVRVRMRAILPSNTSLAPRMEITWHPIGTDENWFAYADYTTVTRSQWQAGAVSRIYNNFAEGTSFGFGHLAVLTREDQYAAFDGADEGYAGELGHRRMERVAGESGVQIFVNAPDGMPAMGPQRPMSLLETLDDIALVDGGILTESMEGRALLYRGRSSIYNQAPRLAVSYAQVAPPLLPVDDDQHLVNDATVSRPGGSRASSVVESGPMSVQDPPDGVGRYDTALEVNAYSDDQLQPYADWMVHTGTWEESRYPLIRLNLRTNPELIPDVLRLQLLDRVVVNDPPEWLPPDPIDVLVQGWTETLTLTTWDLELNCTPYGPWDVGALAGLDAKETFEDSTPTIPWRDGGDAPWTRTTADAHTGAWCLRSGVITANQTSEAVFDIPPEAVSLSFWYRTSSEQAAPGYQGDRLTILVDDQEVWWVSGVTQWTFLTLDVRDAQTVTFRYSKDNSVDAGADAAYIDDLVLTSIDTDLNDYRADTDGSILHLPIDDQTDEFTVTVTDGPMWVRNARPLHDNPNFEEDLSGWSATGSTLARVATPAGTPFSSPWCMEITPDGVTSDPGATTTQAPVFQGTQYEVVGWLRCNAAQDVSLSVVWYDESGEYLSTSSAPTVAQDQWRFRRSLWTPPAGAALAAVVPTIMGTPTSDVRLLVARALIRPYVPDADSNQFPLPVTVGGEHMVVSAIEDSIYDTFSRTVVDGWGEADSGDPWTLLQGNPSEFAVNGEAGTVRLDPEYLPQTQLRGMEHTYAYGNVEVVLCISSDSIPPTSPAVHLVGPFSNGVTAEDSTRFYWTCVGLNYDGRVALQVRDVVSPVGAAVFPGVTYGPGTKIWLRSRTDNHRVRARVWLDGEREPVGWQIDRTIPDPWEEAQVGSVGFLAASTDPNAVPTFSVHEFRMVNPQTFWVKRGDLALPHPAGSAVNVTNPLRIAW